MSIILHISIFLCIRNIIPGICEVWYIYTLTFIIRIQDRYTLDPTVAPVPKFQHYIVHQAEGTGRYYLVRGREFGDIYQLVEHYKVSISDAFALNSLINI